MLRKIEVFVGDEKIKFPTHKTQELLVYIICNFDCIIFKNELLESLCEEAGESSIRNMRLTLFRLRKTFEQAGIGQDIISIGTDYTIKITDGICDYIDIKKYMKNNISINGKNVEKYEELIKDFHGEFMSDIDKIWISEEKSLFYISAEDLHISIALFHLSKSRNIDAEEYLLKVIGINLLREQAYDLLLDLYIKLGHVEKFTVYFKQYYRMMNDELNCTPDSKLCSIINAIAKLTADWHIMSRAQLARVVKIFTKEKGECENEKKGI